MLAWRGCFFFFFSVSPAMLPEAGGLGPGCGAGRGGGQWEGSKNRQSQPFPGGLGVRPPPPSICLSGSLCHPALPAQRSPGQRAGIPG